MTTYREAGVDIDAGDEFVDRIKPLVRSTFRPEVLTDLGGFGGLFRLQSKLYADPVLVSGTDGVGTKLKIAFLMDRHDTVGIDLVAMCVNDIAVSGAEPLFFLDYFATGKLSVEKAQQVVTGIAEGCRQAGCALIGGETAEMPSLYPEGEYDLAGFAVGVVDKPKIIDGKSIKPGDAILGLASSGLHSNGYSLARRVFLEKAKLSVSATLPELDRPLGEALLTPTRIYAKQILALVKEFRIKGIAHITGGGITENLPRVFPQGVRAQNRPEGLDRSAHLSGIEQAWRGRARGDVPGIQYGHRLDSRCAGTIGECCLEESRRTGRSRLADWRHRGIVRSGTGGGVCRLSRHPPFA